MGTGQFQNRAFPNNMILLMIIFCLVYREVFPLCTHDFRVILSERENNDKIINEYNVDFGTDDYFWENGALWGCICNVKKCVRKCCPKYESFREKKCQKSGESEDIHDYVNSLGFKLEDIHIVYSELYCDLRNNSYRIQLEDFVLYSNGSVFVEEANELFGLDQYCIETLSTTDEVVVIVCGPSDGNLDSLSKTEGYNFGKCCNEIINTCH